MLFSPSLHNFRRVSNGYFPPLRILLLAEKRRRVLSHRPKAPPETFSVVERIMWRTCPSRRRKAAGHADADVGAACAIPRPEQCDHTPVVLPSKRGKWKKGKPQGRGARVPTPKKQAPNTDTNLPAVQPSKSALGRASKDGEASQPGARGEVPDDGIDHQEDERTGRHDGVTRSAGDEVERAAPDSDAEAGRVDAAVMEAMGFGGFGGSRNG